MSLSALKIKNIILKMASVIEENKAFLTELDSAIGDADHGINMNKGFQAAAEKIKALDTDDVGTIFKTVGMALVSNVGGASGPLYGTAYMRMGAASAGKKEIEINDFAVLMDAAIEGIKMRGKAELGDKTMLDALIPACLAVHEAVNKGMSPLSALEMAKDAALKGAEGTKDVEARKGRASYLGPRSIGHRDPGAMSSYLMLNTVFEGVSNLEG